MSLPLIARSPDLKRLRDEGYDVQLVQGYLLVRDVPYLNNKREIKRGTLIAALTMANNVALQPADHVALFAGEYPCHVDGNPIERIRNSVNNTDVGAGVISTFSFSAKPKPAGNYANFYDKMSTYADILSGPAQAIDPSITAKTFPVVREDVIDDVFKYVDTASSRADITAIGAKIALRKIAVIGLGGTGSYVLDLVAKTPVREIHLFDGDAFLQHNAFRAPGAASGDELAEKLPKVEYFARIYGKMRNGIVAHPYYASPENLAALADVDFVFLCMEGGGKRAIVQKLEEMGRPFIDVGMGVYVANEALGGVMRTTTSVEGGRSHVWDKQRIPFSQGDGRNEYDKNIQIADLNALNAAFAVIKWKKLFGFYVDQEKELYSTYTIGGNDVDNQDAA
ncbi:MAG TPA: ThiF family adenylyltransferase [Rhizomicrobium sp.]